MPTPPRAALEAALQNPNYLDVSCLPNVVVDLRYGTTQNLLNKNVYDGFQLALLHIIAAGKFAHASCLLALQHPEFKFVIFDALRPQAAQLVFWDLVKGTAQQSFFADPAKGSLHSFGFALDLSLLDANGQALDMGTAFDDLTELAGPQNEQKFLATGALSSGQLANRLLLRSIMEEAGFIQLPHEWWHFDALPGAEVRAKYQLCE